MNRKSILISFGVTCLAVLAGYGVSKTVSDDTDLEILTLSNVEALADGEVKWNHWTQWFSQGLTQNEREIEQVCPSESNSSGKVDVGGVSVEGSDSQKNPPQRTDIRCATGSNNCSRVRC